MKEQGGICSEGDCARIVFGDMAASEVAAGEFEQEAVYSQPAFASIWECHQAS